MYLVFFLFVMYAINLTVLIGSIGYVTWSFLSKKYLQWENPLLAGNRLPLAMVLCTLWIIYVTMDLFQVITYIDKYYPHISHNNLLDKFIRETIDCCGTIINVILLTGKGIKEWKR
jgi:hypothetical protein